MDQEIIVLEIHIEQVRQGTYFTVPFTVPDDIETIQINYEYQRRPPVELPLESGFFTAMNEMSIIDLGVVDALGRQVGASGSDKTEVMLSETTATPGYKAGPITVGEWQIIVGAYKVAADGVDVRYTIRFTRKSLRLLKGDLHVHSVGSDGVHTLEELGFKARANGLDFLAITDHNQMVTKDALPDIPGLTLIPGVEWTHYRGHANFLGVDRPYDEPFFTNSDEEVVARFTSARQRGALITLNHPFEGSSSFQFDMQRLPFDCLEVWNGPMRESNLRAVGLWQHMLAGGLRIPICGGSDYHRDTPFIFLGGPTMGVYARSAGASDILTALRQGHSFITFAPEGPVIEMTAGEGMPGDEVNWNEQRELRIKVTGLLAGDEVKVITADSQEILCKATADGALDILYKMTKPGFARVEVARAFLPGLPLLPALLTNPIYFKV